MSSNTVQANKVTNLFTAITSRRRFLRFGAAAAAGVATTGALAACADSGAYVPKSATETAIASRPTATPVPPTVPAMDHGAMAAPTAAGTDWQMMDRMHEAGVKAFPAKTQGQGMQPLAFRLDGDVKVFELTTKKVMWEVEPGQLMEAWTYNGQLPGPEVRVTEGDKVRFVVKNELDESTAIHWHGVMVPNSMDGVPFITQPVIKPGETFSYEFVARNAGSHMYHSHHNSTRQVSMGLLGPFIIEPKDKSKIPNTIKNTPWS